MTDSPDPLDVIVDVITDTAARRRMSHLEAARYAERHLGIGWETLLQPALDEIDRRLSGAEAISAAGAVVKASSYAGRGWYLGAPAIGQWAKYLALLESKKAPGIDALEEETAGITRLLTNPNALGERRKGLVMGNVQSGKTRNFAGVIARAADAGYRFVIVLAGIYNNIREQTQVRLDQDIFSDPWYRITSQSDDFLGVSNLGLLLERQEFVSAVIKKNKAPLLKLIEALASVPVEARRRYPILIIDDEADQATPNSAKAAAEVSTINGCVRELWKLVQTGTYVAYTATPFANVLIDPEADDLFPEDFITTISTGDGYFGAEQVFGITEWINEDGSSVKPGLDMVRDVTTQEAKQLRPPSNKDMRLAFDPELPASLIEAVEWFVVASAIRRSRNQTDHSSMLIHLTHYADPHFAMRARLQELVADMRRWDEARFMSSWTREAARVRVSGAEHRPWEAVRPHLDGVLAEIEVIVDNGSSSDRLNYGGDPKTVIVVGGGTLSRGLTLEGLVVSYFTRTSSAYDTLLQMGRWFGYRPGYEDLPRIWVSPGLGDDYAFLAMVERDLRAEIESFKGSAESPRDLGVRVRVHPGRLSVTADNKMRAAKNVQLGFNGVLRQIYILDGSDPGIAESNRLAIENLVAGHELTPLPWAESRLMTQGVTGSAVSSFLEAFQAHQSHKWLSDTGLSNSLGEWISRFAQGPVWNVVIMGNSSLGPEVELAGHTVRGLNRNALRRRTEFPGTIDLGAVVSQGDRIADIPPELYQGEPDRTDEDRRRIRRKHGGGHGLVMIYPISGFNEYSRPQSAQPDAERVPLEVSHAQWAFALIGPYVDDSSSHDAFISVKTNWDSPESDEDEDTLAALREGSEEDPS